MKSTSRRVLIRADAGQGTGYGHIVRCMTIARVLTSHDVDVVVAVREPSEDVIARVHQAGARVHRMRGSHPAGRAVLAPDVQRSDALAALAHDDLSEDDGWDVVIVDHYRLDAVWENEARTYARCLVAIDDLADRHHDVDVLVDHNWYGDGTANRYQRLVPSHTVQLLGPRYCLLDAAYATQRATRRDVQRPPRRLLVNFGGTDAAGQTMTAALAALSHTDLRVEIVVGSPAAVSEQLAELAASENRVTLHIAQPNLASLLAQVDLVIGASGTGTWERMCMGVPSIVTTVNESQSGVTRALSQAKACVWLGVAANVGEEDYANALTQAISGDEISPLEVVDGFGSARVALRLMDSGLEDAERRPATDADNASYVSLRASVDPDSGPEQWRAFDADFKRLRADGSHFDILSIEDVPIGVELRLRSGNLERLTDASIEGGKI